jgi:hypothetical protein
MEFEQQQLRQVLTESNEEPTEQKTVALAGRLRAIKQRHRARQAEREQVPHKKDLLEAILQIRNSTDSILKTLDEPSVVVALSAFKPEFKIVREIEGVRLLRNTAEQARYHLEFVDARHRRQQIQTDLELDLFDAYRDFTGKSGKGDETGEGPLYRFVKACVALIDPDLKLLSPSAFRGRLMAADKRRSRREITCKDLAQIPPLDLHL